MGVKNGLLQICEVDVDEEIRALEEYKASKEYKDKMRKKGIENYKTAVSISLADFQVRKRIDS